MLDIFYHVSTDQFLMILYAKVVAGDAPYSEASPSSPQHVLSRKVIVSSCKKNKASPVKLVNLHFLSWYVEHK